MKLKFGVKGYTDGGSGFDSSQSWFEKQNFKENWIDTTFMSVHKL